MFFFGGIVISVVGLGVLDINQVSATVNIPPTRANVAQRANVPTRTLAPVNSLEQSATPGSEVIIPFSGPLATSTIEPSPTIAATLEPTVTSTIAPTLTPTSVPTVRRTATPNSHATPTITATLNAKRGDSPFSALEMTDAWQKLTPGASLWFKAGQEASYPIRGSIWIDAPVDENGRRGLSLAIYAPEQINGLNAATTPKGRGSYEKTQPSHALFWKGGSPKAGVWYAYLANNNSFLVDYKIGTTFNVTDPKSCFQYWEYIGPVYTLWTECNRPQ